MRIAKRMEIHDESTYSVYTPLEAELRRRLWWSLVTFDHRISEMSGYKTTTLDPTWDCNTPLNVNDSELRRGRTKFMPQQQTSEAIFAVIRSELADFVRHSAFHLNFINPSLNALAKPSDTQLESLENTIEEKYLQFCDFHDPLHCMTVWTARAYIARIRLIEYYSKHSASSSAQTDAKIDEALTYAMTMLEYDTNLITSPLTKGYAWFVDFCMPGLAYNHILNDLRRRPAMSQSRAAWDVMSDNYEARAARLKPEGGPNYVAAFSRLALKTWSSQQEAASTATSLPLLETPRIIHNIRNRMQAQKTTLAPEQDGMVLEPGTLVDLQNGGGDLGTDFFDMSGQNGMNIDNFLSAIDWRWLQAQGW
jgi:Fungal specific transcription factor domain